MLDEPLTVVRSLGALLDQLDVAWAAAGSFASGLHGTPRMTSDVDVLLRASPADVARLAAMTGDEFFVDAESLVGAWKRGESYNLIHATTMMKVDVFPALDRFSRGEITRAISVAGVRVISAEDTLLSKLVWFRKGGERSERQWRDVLGIASVQRGRLDLAYVDAWATELGVEDLLARVRGDSSGGL